MPLLESVFCIQVLNSEILHFPKYFRFSEINSLSFDWLVILLFDFAFFLIRAYFFRALMWCELCCISQIRFPCKLLLFDSVSWQVFSFAWQVRSDSLVVVLLLQFDGPYFPLFGFEN